jgi:hypothetical protein
MKRLLTAVVAAAALWAAACSSGGGRTIQPPPPTGNFSNASLSGTYAFVTSGEAITSSAGTTSEIAFARTGSFTANGSGGIQGGVYDVVNAGGATIATIPITGGSYTISADGRGALKFDVTSNGAPATISFGIVLTSTSDGLMMDETATGNQASTGSGNFVLQNPAMFASGVSGSYVFDFSGLDANQRGESLVGRFAASGGVITSGMEDANDGTTLSSGSISGNFTPDLANAATSGRGTAIIAGQSYAFYIVDSNRVRFISNNTATAGSGPMLTGDAVLQLSVPANPTGSFAFLVAGSSANGGLTRVGRFNVSANTLSNIVMDVNNGGSENGFGSGSLSNGRITYDAATGRGQLSFQSSAANVYTFVFYLSSPSSGVIQEVSGTPGTGIAVVVDDGSIVGQSGSPFTASNISGNYAMNWSGLETTGGTFQDEEDLVSQVKISNLSLSGTSDIFQFSSSTLFTDLGTAGQITLNGDGTSNNTMTVNLSQASPIKMVTYIVNPQLAFFINTNVSGAPRNVAGILKAQQ